MLRLAVVVGALILAGCGGSGKEDASSSSTTAADGSSTTVDSQAFQECMKDQGVDLPDNFAGGGAQNGGTPPTGGGTPPTGGSLPEGVDTSKLQKAMQACQDKLGTSSPLGDAGSVDFSAYTSCMSDHGVSVTGSGPGGVDQSDPDYAAANTACQALLPTLSSSTTTAP